MEDRHVLVIHWNSNEAEEYANSLRADGYKVDVESRDGNHALRSIRKHAPDAVAIFLARQPALGRQTAGTLIKVRKMEKVPIIFVGGKEDAVAKAISVLPNATFTELSELPKALSKLITPKRRGKLARLKKWF